MHRYQTILRSFFRERLLACRREHRCTQEDMAENLHIAPRSYVKLEHGTCSCSACTLLFFLLYLSEPDARLFLEEFRTLVREEDEHEVA